MVSVEQIGVVLNGISVLANLIRLRRESLRSDREPTPSQIETVSRETVSATGFEWLRQSIEQSTLDAIGGVIDRARQRFEDAMHDPANSRQARDSEEEVARSVICAELSRIQRLNDGLLPESFERIRREFRCAPIR